MTRQPAPQTAEDMAIQAVDREDTAALDSLARSAGPPADSESLSDADLDRLWALTDRTVDNDPDAFATKLMTTGLSQQELPMLKVLKEHPDWAPLYGQPTQDAELADQYTQMARYPYRWMILEGIDDPDEQVRVSDRLDRRYQKAHAEKIAQADTIDAFRSMDEPAAAPAQPAAPMPMPIDPAPAAPMMQGG